MNILTLKIDYDTGCTTGTQPYQWLTMLADCFCSNWYFALHEEEHMFGTQCDGTIVYIFSQSEEQ